MKSIMEEASTIFKAIEKAWIRAEKPQSFSIKLLEEPTKNFIGMTVKPAKIAFLFEEIASSKAAKPSHVQPMPQPAKKQQTSPHQPQQKKQAAPAQPAKPQSHQPQQTRKPVEHKPVQAAPRPANNEQIATVNAEAKERQPLIWHDNMAKAAQDWLKETLTLLNKPMPATTTEIKNKHLIIAFETPIAQDSHQERMLFSSLSHLALQVVRNQFKNQARGLKIILKTNS